MGTDIYLEWDNIEGADKEKQYTGFSVDAGKAGYLRASIGMYQENIVLRQIFPSTFWNNESGEYLPYEFTDTGFEDVQIIGARYLTFVMFGIPLEEDEGATEQLKFGESIMRMLGGMGFDNIEGGARKSSLRFAVMWLNAVFNFYLLGLEKAKEEKNPRVYISW
ncbi:MAG: hypothetical protein ABID54_01320 [Pseudomonadota bacterium]